MAAASSKKSKTSRVSYLVIRFPIEYEADDQFPVVSHSSTTGGGTSTTKVPCPGTNLGNKT